MSEIFITKNYSVDAVLSLLAEVFGEEEAELEKVQIDGTEMEYNTDIVFSAVEDEMLLGTVHITIPNKCKEIAGISGVCTAPFARGRKIAKVLFEKAMCTLREMGVSIVFLGTGNPVAAKLYSSFGFSYMPASHVMVNSFDCSVYDKFSQMFTEAYSDVKFFRGTPDLRMPIIPLINKAERLVVADINASVLGRGVFSQNSCMSIYPKYDSLRKYGGDYFGAVGKNGMYIAVASVLPVAEGVRADFCCDEKSTDEVNELIKLCEEKYGEVFFQIADADTKKNEIMKKFGYSIHGETTYKLGNRCLIPMSIWKR